MSQTNIQDPIAHPPVSAAKIVMWTILFQIAWSWKTLTVIVREGVMPGPDDFMRLSQVRDLLNGQGWFDTKSYHMLFPQGADIHWSRLIDAPIAGLVWFFDLFVSQQMAERLTTIVWPTLVLIATVWVITKVCDSLIPNYNRLLPVFFTVLCVSSLAQFVPGRIDHHNVQILLYAGMLWSLVNWQRANANWLAGLIIPLSVAIGLDVLIFFVLFMAWFGLEWVGGSDKNGKALTRFGLALLVGSIVLYPINIAPTQWFVAHCDAYSIVYLSAFWMIGGAMMVMGLASNLLRSENNKTQMGLRLAVAAALAGVCAVAIFALFPHCIGGPYAAVSPELNERWLSQVSEAKSLFAVLAENPDYWIKTVAYCFVMFGVGGWLMMQPIDNKARFAVVFAAFAASVLLSMYQYRTIRIGFFAAIPLCVLATGLIAMQLREKFGAKSPIAIVGQIASVILLSTASWALVGGILLAKPVTATARSGDEANATQSAKAPNRPTCFHRADYDFLSTLEPGHAMSDLNSAPAVMTFTNNTVVSGPYHRNGEAILDVMDFFLTDGEIARAIADKHKVDYVILCKNKSAKRVAKQYEKSVRAGIMKGASLPWMELLSPTSDKVAVYRIKR